MYSKNNLLLILQLTLLRFIGILFMYIICTITVNIDIQIKLTNSLYVISSRDVTYWRVTENPITARFTEWKANNTLLTCPITYPKLHESE